MIDWNYAVPLAGVLLGWVLNELSFAIRIRREDKRIMARALSELLELRHRAFAVKRAKELLLEQFPIPPEVQPVVTQVLETILPN